ncbi:MAG: hypothetical protein ABJ004_18070 [Cyclobacteriaceae bacterium]
MKKITLKFAVIISGLFSLVQDAKAEIPDSKILADGKQVSAFVLDAESFEFQFAMTEDAAKNGYGLTGAFKMMAKAQGFAFLPYVVEIKVIDNARCGEESNPIFQTDGQVKTLAWTDIVKAGETINVTIEGSDIYDNIDYMLSNCEGSISEMKLEISLLTIHKNKSNESSAKPEHLLSKIVMPVSSAAINSMKNGADEKIYQEFVSGNKANKVKDEALVKAIETALLNLDGSTGIKITTIHIQDIAYQNTQQTVLNWYAHNIFKNAKGQCKYGYIYGEASRRSGGYSITYINGEREDFISCEYAEKLRNR